MPRALFQGVWVLICLTGSSVTAAASGVAISWTDNSPDETGFSIERARDGVTFVEIATVVANMTSYADSGLSIGQYWYRVRAFSGSTYSDYSPVVNVTLTAPLAAIPLPVISSQPVNTSVSLGSATSLSVTATSTASLSYQWKKDGVDIAGAVFATYAISSVQANDAAAYTVSVTNSAGNTLSQVATLSILSPSAGTALSGTVISSSPWSNLAAYSGGKVFDNDTNSFFSGQSSDALVYVGLDFGSSKVLQSINYFPRAGFGARMKGGSFRGANRADLGDAVTLYVIPSVPAEGQWQTVTLSAPTGYRYVFYTSDSSNQGDVAEIRFYGGDEVATPSLVSTLSGTVISSASWSNMTAYSGGKVFDGDTNSFFSGNSNDALVYVGLDFGSPKILRSISYFPRSGFSGRMRGGRFRGANRADFADAVTLYTLALAPAEGQWQTVPLAVTSGYRYVFYTTDSSNQGDVAEIKFTGTSSVATPAAPLVSHLAGTTICSLPWNNISAYSGAKVFDGDTNSFFSGRPSDSFVYVGQDLSAPRIIDAISYYPRAGWSWRMNGGRFCGANRADLGDAVTLCTVTSVPAEGQWTTVTLPASTAGYRYLFYTTVSTNSADVAEVEFYGHDAPATSVNQSGETLSGSTISSAPWNDVTTYQGGKAFDSDTTTFFSGKSWDAFVYVGQDFGSARPVGAISYFPRAGFTARMRGGRFCGANKADLSDAVTLYTISATPPEGAWQNVVLPSSTNTYRYVFYTTDPVNSADVAEIIFKAP